MAGTLIGALWAWIAPPIHGVVALTRSGERVRAYLGNEADHFFIGAFLIVGMLSVLAVVAAVLVWQWRAHRGPILVAALSVGSAAAAAAAAGVGAVLVRWRYGTIDVAAAPISPGIGCITSPRRPPCSSGIRRCRSRRRSCFRQR